MVEQPPEPGPAVEGEPREPKERKGFSLFKEVREGLGRVVDVAQSTMEVLADTSLRSKAASLVSKHTTKRLKNLQKGVQTRAETFGRGLAEGPKQVAAVLARLQARLEEQRLLQRLEEQRDAPVDVQVGPVLYEDAPQELRSRLWSALLQYPELHGSIAEEKALEAEVQRQNSQGLSSAPSMPDSLRSAASRREAGRRERRERASLERRERASRSPSKARASPEGKGAGKAAKQQGREGEEQQAPPEAGASGGGQLAPPGSQPAADPGAEASPSAQGLGESLSAVSSPGHERQAASAAASQPKTETGGAAVEPQQQPSTVAGPGLEGKSEDRERQTAAEARTSDAGEPLTDAGTASPAKQEAALPMHSPGEQSAADGGQAPAPGASEKPSRPQGEQQSSVNTASQLSAARAQHAQSKPRLKSAFGAKSPKRALGAVRLTPAQREAAAAGGQPSGNGDSAPPGATQGEAALDEWDMVAASTGLYEGWQGDPGLAETLRAEAQAQPQGLALDQAPLRQRLQAALCQVAWPLSTLYGEHSRYNTLLQISVGQEETDEVIARDIGRTFPEHPQFGFDQGRQALFRVLKAYSLHDLEVGYCQGMAFVVGVLLMYVPEEAAFDILCRLLRARGEGGAGLRAFYLPGLEGLKHHLRLFEWLLGRLLPALKQHLEELSALPVLYASQWFLTCFACPFPQAFACRVVDVLLTENSPAFLPRVALAIVAECGLHLLEVDDFEEAITYLKVEPVRWSPRQQRRILNAALEGPVTEALLAEAEGALGEGFEGSLARKISSRPSNAQAAREAAQAAAEAPTPPAEGAAEGAPAGSAPAAAATAAAGAEGFIPVEMVLAMENQLWAQDIDEADKAGLVDNAWGLEAKAGPEAGVTIGKGAL